MAKIFVDNVTRDPYTDKITGTKDMVTSMEFKEAEGVTSEEISGDNL